MRTPSTMRKRNASAGPVDGLAMVGAAVEKAFVGYGVFQGAVTAFHRRESPRSADRWTVTYSDGDQRDYEWAQLAKILRESPLPAVDARQNASMSSRSTTPRRQGGRQQAPRKRDGGAGTEQSLRTPGGKRAAPKLGILRNPRAAVPAQFAKSDKSVTAKKERSGVGATPDLKTQSRTGKTKPKGSDQDRHVDTVDSARAGSGKRRRIGYSGNTAILASALRSLHDESVENGTASGPSPASEQKDASCKGVVARAAHGLGDAGDTVDEAGVKEEEMTEYEKKRLANIERNAQILKGLGIGTHVTALQRAASGSSAHCAQDKPVRGIAQHPRVDRQDRRGVCVTVCVSVLFTVCVCVYVTHAHSMHTYT